MTLLRFILIPLISLYPHMSLGHEFWIEPESYQIETDADLIAHLRNGEKFKGSSLAYFENRTARFEMIEEGQSSPLGGRMGDVPALQTTAPRDGLLILIHETTASSLTYKDWEKFARFAEHKDFPDMRARHNARNLPESGFEETYRRFAKALVAVGDGKGSDRATGMETEFVALTNPYTASADEGVRVQLLYQNEPLANAQIEVFDKAPDDNVVITLLRSDAKGEAVIPVTSGHSYLIDAVRLRPATGEAVWETLWAALTFAVP